VSIALLDRDVMAVLEVVHELPDNLHRVQRLVVVHCDPDGVRRDAQGVGPDVQPTQIVVGLCEEFLDELVVSATAGPDGEYHLHARPECVVGHKGSVETVGVVDEVVEQI